MKDKNMIEFKFDAAIPCVIYFMLYDDYKSVTKILSSTSIEYFIKSYDPENRSPRHARYIPFWA